DAEERDLLRDIERTTRRTIPAEDRRRDTRMPLSPPERRPHGHGAPRGPGGEGRGAKNDRGSRQERQQRSFHARQQQGARGRGPRSSGRSPSRGGATRQGASGPGSY